MEFDHYPLTADLTNAIPLHGESQLEIDVAEKIVRMERGKVSFLEKALMAQHKGAKAVVITQSAPVWPFVMTDSSSGRENLAIPIFMISQKDGLVVDKLMGASRNAISASIHVSKCDDFCCSICQEEMQAGIIRIDNYIHTHIMRTLMLGYAHLMSICPYIQIRYRGGNFEVTL